VTAESVPGLWLTNCSVVDVQSGKIERQRSLHIADGLIERIADGSGAIGGPALDLGGAYITPGLISCHAHLWQIYPFSAIDRGESPAISIARAAKRARDALLAGVTTLRSVGELNRADLYLRFAARQGWLEAPRILGAGQPIAVTGGHGSESSAIADGGEGFLRAAREELAAGADHIKIFITGGLMRIEENLDAQQMTDDEIAGAVHAATEHNTYVTAHAASSPAIRQALRLGVRGFEHAYRLDNETATLMAESHAFLTPTLCVSHPRSADWMQAHGWEPWAVQLAQDAGKEHRLSIKRAINADVTLVNGTDYPPGDAIDGTPVAVYEMELMVEAGLTPLGAIQAATINGARLLRLNNVGTVEEGMCADLIGMSSDPTHDIRAMRGIRFVMQAGRVVRNAS
jgi:imidazolonepropionase-like amidohydrolase